MGLPFSGDFWSSVSDTVSRETAEFVDSISGQNSVLLDGFDSVVGTDIGGWAAGRVAQNEGNQQRADLHGEANRIAGEFGLDTLPSTVQTESFEAMPHEVIKTMVDSIQAGPVFESAQTWRAAEQAVTELVTEFQEAISAVTSSDWQGQAAAGAQGGVTLYADESRKLGGAFTLVGNKMEEAYTGFAQTKAQLPEPNTESSFVDVVRGGLEFVVNPGSVVRMVGENDEARQEAIRVMNTVYKPVVHQADAGVPILPVAFDPTDPSSDTTGRPDGGPAAGPSFGGPSSVAGPPPPGGMQSGAPLATAPAASTAPSSIGPAGAAPAMPGGAAPAAPSVPPGSGLAQDNARNPFFAPATAGMAGSGAGPGTGSGGGSRGSVSAGSGFGGAGARTGAGAAVPLGAPQKSVPVASGTSGGARAATGTGAGRMGGGMMPGGARGQGGDDDTEHKTPDYLINVQNGNELIGDLPPVAPPVLGG